MSDLLKKRLKIWIHMPNYEGKVCTHTLNSLIPAVVRHQTKFIHHQIDVKFQVRKFVTYAAERACEQAVSEGYDYMVFWGDDILAPPDVLERLLAHGKEVVACSVFGRSEPYPFYAYDNDHKLFNINRVNTGLQKCRGAGTGLMLIKTSLFEGLEKPWWVMPASIEADMDLEWCLKVTREKGTQFWVDTDLIVQHLDFSPRCINEKTHQSFVDFMLKSGVLHHPEIRGHKDFAKLEGMLNV